MMNTGVFETVYNPMWFAGFYDRESQGGFTGPSTHQQVRLHGHAGIKH
jgi:hypothetical protein